MSFNEYHYINFLYVCVFLRLVLNDQWFLLNHFVKDVLLNFKNSIVNENKIKRYIVVIFNICIDMLIRINKITVHKHIKQVSWHISVRFWLYGTFLNYNFTIFYLDFQRPIIAKQTCFPLSLSWANVSSSCISIFIFHFVYSLLFRSAKWSFPTEL